MTYRSMIKEAIGSTDDVLAGVVEELMRVRWGVLDGLSFREFGREARMAKGDAEVLREIDPECFAWYVKCAGVAA